MKAPLINLNYFKLVIISTVLFLPFKALSISQDSFKLNLKVGVNMMLGWNSSPSFFYSVGAGITYYDNDDWKWVTPSLGLTANLYKGTIGTSVHPEKINEIQFDLIGSASLSFGASRKNKYDFQEIESFHIYTSDAVTNRYDAASLTLGSSYLFNNNKRNQHIGHVGLSVCDVSLMYYNDGGPIVNHLSLGDRFDRWWTGGITLSVHPRNLKYRFKASYAVFTGYLAGAYEVSSLMQLKAIIYKDADQYFLNNGFLSVEFQHDSGFGLGIDLVSDKLMVLQNSIHTGLRTAHHPSVAPWSPKLRLFYDPVYTLSDFQ